MAAEAGAPTTNRAGRVHRPLPPPTTKTAGRRQSKTSSPPRSTEEDQKRDHYCQSRLASASEASEAAAAAAAAAAELTSHLLASKRQPATTLAAKQPSQHQAAVESAQRARAASQQREDRNPNSGRVPTFGATSERLPQPAPPPAPQQQQQQHKLPYYSYHGRARNLDPLGQQGERRFGLGARKQQAAAAAAAAATTSDGNNSASACSSSSLSPPTATSSSGSSAAAAGGAILNRSSARRRPPLLERGYSNISNLFRQTKATARPNWAAATSRQMAPGRQQQQPQQLGLASSRSAHDLSSAKQSASMRRQNTTLAGPPAATFNIGQQQLRRRPNSAAAGSLYSEPQLPRRRSPSSSSLYRPRHQHPHQQQQQPSPHYVGAWTYELDPDCPVHGDGGADQLAADYYSPTRGNSFQLYQQQQQPRQSRRPGPGAAELLYADEQPRSPVAASQQQQQHPRRPTPTGGSQTNLAWTGNNWTGPGGGAGPFEPADAYYNRLSRFSLYSGGTTDSGRPRSSLAPSHEQVRRILGAASYQQQASLRERPPASGTLLIEPRPVYLHPQWAYSRPFIHMLGTRHAHHQSAESDQSGESADQSGDSAAELDAVLSGRGPSYSSQRRLRRRRRGQPRDKPRFAIFNQLRDAQAIRAVDFHPSGQVYAVGSNSRALRICAYPAMRELQRFSGQLADHEHDADHDEHRDRREHDADEQQQQQDDERRGQDDQRQPGGRERAPPSQPRVLFKFLQVHRGSIYCVAFNPGGQLLATGSNDQTVHLVRYNSQTHTPDGDEFRLSMHDGTVRELCFIDSSAAAGSGSLLLSAGAGDNKIYATDCETVTPFQSMAGHSQTVMGLAHVSGAQFVSCSQDRTIRFWDLRTRGCTAIVSGPAGPAAAAAAAAAGSVADLSPSPGGGGGGGEPIVPARAGPGAPVCSLAVDPSGRLLASGHSDATCMLYDIRAARCVQAYRAHRDEVRSVSFSPHGHYLLTGGYDNRLILTDLQGDLVQALPSARVAECQDKVVQVKWHPTDYTFVSTSADRSATLWALPAD